MQGAAHQMPTSHFSSRSKLLKRYQEGDTELCVFTLSWSDRPASRNRPPSSSALFFRDCRVCLSRAPPCLPCRRPHGALRWWWCRCLVMAPGTTGFSFLGGSHAGVVGGGMPWAQVLIFPKYSAGEQRGGEKLGTSYRSMKLRSSKLERATKVCGDK